MSPGMQEIYKMIGQIATSDVSILINGESGTGKELVARAVYNYSNRAREKFMALNCAAIPEHLLESELFGYEKGAFTGAAEKRIGKFEQVSGGTLFLDEIGDMPMPLQAKLLRVLQEKQIERVGGTETIPVDVRIISATNRDLESEIKAGKFREDLYYRLNVVTIKIPALRDRKTDIPDLVDYFVARGNLEYKKSVKEISKKALETLMNYSWPGNVRQLENIIKKAVVISSGSVLTMDDEFIKKVNDHSSEAMVSSAIAPTQAILNDFPGYFEKSISNLFDQMMLLPEEHPYREDMLTKIEKILIEKSLNYFEGNQVKTAKFLGMTRNTLRSRIEEK
jgi:two-component system nitrogen regulation response regulator GlnG